MKKRHIVILFAVMSLSGLGCGDSSDAETSPEAGESLETVEKLSCPAPGSLEPEDCTVDVDESDTGILEDLEKICNSPCKTVKGWLDLRELDGLKNLEALTGVETITRSLNLVKNPDLESLEGLESLKEVQSALAIKENGNLKNLEGIESLKVVKRLEIDGNPRLESIESLKTLEEVTGMPLRVMENPKLKSLEGLNNVRSTQALFIIDNDSLVNLEGVESLESASLRLLIQENDNLESMTALPQIRDAYQVFAIEDNPKLPTCQAEAYADGLDEFERSAETIEGNDTSASCDE